MSKITELTSFIKGELPTLHDLAGETHELAKSVKDLFVGIVGNMNTELRGLHKELTELQQAQALISNGPPSQDEIASNARGRPESHQAGAAPSEN